MSAYLPCDLCQTGNPKFVLDSPTLDGPLVQCAQCGLRYVGRRKSRLAFGGAAVEQTAEMVKQANLRFRDLRLEEEQRLALLNARWRLDWIRKRRPSGKLLEIGCARGDFLKVAKEHFDVKGVEPNPELAKSAERIAPVYRDIVENTPWDNFDVVVSFHVIEHVDSPSRFIAAAVQRLKPGGMLVIETPNAASLPFKLFRSKWRQFIPEHYFFFDPSTIQRLLRQHGLTVESLETAGKYASIELILNRVSRYLPWLPSGNRFPRLTFRMNPLDIMVVCAVRTEP